MRKVSKIDKLLKGNKERHFKKKDKERIKKYIFMKIKNEVLDTKKSKTKMRMEAGYPKITAEKANIEKGQLYTVLTEYLTESIGTSFYVLVDDFNARVERGEHQGLDIQELAKLIKLQHTMLKAVAPTIRQIQTHKDEQGNEFKIWKEYSGN